MFLAWITLKKTIKTKCNPGYSNYMSNSFLTKKFLSVNRKKKKNHGLIKYNKINTNDKLKVIKKSLDKHRNTLHGNTNQWLTSTNLFLQTKTHGQWPHTRANKIFKQINKSHSEDRPHSHEYWNTSHMPHIYLIKSIILS